MKKFIIKYMLTGTVLFMASVVYVPLGLASQVVASDAAVDVIVATYSGIKNTRDLVTTPDSE